MSIEVYIVMVVFYFLVGTIIALISRRIGVKSSIDYYVAGYKLSGLLAAMTYAATTYSAFMMIGLVGFSYATGVGAFGFELMYLLATIFLLTIFAPRVWVWARKNKWVTPSQMLGELYGSRFLALVVAVVYLLALIPYATAQLVGLANLFEGLGLGYSMGLLFGIATVFLWTYLAGIWSVATTDLYQGLWMIISSLLFFSWILLFLLPSNGVDIGEFARILGDNGYLGITGFWKLPVFIAFTLPWIFFAVTNPQVVQRIYMPKNKKSLKTMILYFSLFGLVYTVVVTLIGLSARVLTIVGAFPELAKQRDLVTPTLISLSPVLLGSIVFVSIIAAAVSTLDSIILTLSSTTSNDVYGYWRKNRSSKNMYINYIVIVILVIVTGSIAAFKPGFVVELSVLSSVMLLPLAPITITAWVYKERVHGKYRTPLVALLSGFLISFYTAIVLGPKKAFITTFYGAPVSFWVLAVSTVITVLGLEIEEKFVKV